MTPDPTDEPHRGGAPEPLTIKDCTMTALATGEEARTLRELRDRLRRLPVGCLYYHFWARLLRPVYRRREFNNDFANWAAFQLRDRVLAERLALLDPADHPETADLQEELVELVEERVVEVEERGTIAADEGFHFLRAELVVFDTHRRARTPAELAELCSQLSRSSVFYHVVDARQRNADGADDFQRWLRGFGDSYRSLRERLQQVDVCFSTLEELRSELTRLCRPLTENEETARA